MVAACCNWDSPHSKGSSDLMCAEEVVGFVYSLCYLDFTEAMKIFPLLLKARNVAGDITILEDVALSPYETLTGHLFCTYVQIFFYNSGKPGTLFIAFSVKGWLAVFVQ